MTFKEKIRPLLRLAYDEEKQFIREFETGEKDSTGAPDDWLAKDIIAHIAYWVDYTLTKTQASMRDEDTEPCPDFNKLNAEIFAANKDKTWQEVSGELERAYRSATKCLETIPDEMMVSEAPAWQEGRPLWRIIVGSCYLHPVAHLSEYYSKKGKAPYALKLHEDSAALARGLSDSPEWLGVLTYNLACGYALAGKHAESIKKLEKAFGNNPELMEWSREDPDLASIRDLEGYRALVGD